MMLALLVFFIPPIFGGAAWGVWFYRALVLLVIACPCALVISTPVSIVSSLTAMARRGVLIKGGAFLEAIGQLKALAVDKTGTIETADIALMKDDLSKVAEAIHLARCTINVIQFNIAFSIAVKLVFLVLAVFGYTSLASGSPLPPTLARRSSSPRMRFGYSDKSRHLSVSSVDTRVNDENAHFDRPVAHFGCSSSCHSTCTCPSLSLEPASVAPVPARLCVVQRACLTE
jgi:hypothetical protein